MSPTGGDGSGSPLKGAHVVLGVSASVAAYKAVDLCRRLVGLGAYVTPVLTADAQRFVGAASFTALGSRRAVTSLFDDVEPIPHTALGRSADVVVVAPATAKVLAEFAHGLSADVLTATLLATRAPVVMCPAMHTEMWEHPAVADNVTLLERRGVLFVGPDVGPLAGGDVGAGRLADPAAIVDALAGVVAARRPGLQAYTSAARVRSAARPEAPTTSPWANGAGKSAPAMAATDVVDVDEFADDVAAALQDDPELDLPVLDDPELDLPVLDEVGVERGERDVAVPDEPPSPDSTDSADSTGSAGPNVARVDLRGVRVLVTAGGTREPLDPVRFIGNRSSGKQGHAFAAAASDCGADVILVTTAAGTLPVPPRVKVAVVETAQQMTDAVMARGHDADIVVMAAAVADFRPLRAADDKIKKDAGIPRIVLEPTTDILATLGRQRRLDPPQVLVGFAAETAHSETDALRELGAAKRRNKGVDLLVANDVTAPAAGFEGDTNAALVILPDDSVVTIETTTKLDLAFQVLQLASQRLTEVRAAAGAAGEPLADTTTDAADEFGVTAPEGESASTQPFVETVADVDPFAVAADTSSDHTAHPLENT